MAVSDGKSPQGNDERVLEFVSAVKRAVGSQFTGVGLIFYSPPLELPIVALRGEEPAPVKLPLKGRAVVEALADMSTFASLWHDGFHLLEAETLTLTHLAQFVSPPIAAFRGKLPQRGGARHMTAALSSLVNGVDSAAVLTADGRASIYRGGQCVVCESLQ